MKREFAPIVLFTFCRPLHTKNVLDSLALNKEAKETDLYIFCDGTKEGLSADKINAIEKVREIALAENRFKSVVVEIQKQNLGLSKSVINGVTTVINKHGEVIVLEDDLIVSPYFLNYMNDGLERYLYNDKIAEIGGCNYFACGNKFPNYFISPMAETLGWATWKDRWDKFNLNAVEIYKQLENKKLQHKFNCYGAYDMMGMLNNHILGKVNSWAIQWQGIMVLNDIYCLHSNLSFVQHIESFEATHAPLNIVPPMHTTQPLYETIIAIEDNQVIQALKESYAGKTDYYGNLKPYYKKKELKKKIKSFFRFLIPYKGVISFKNNK